MSPRLPRKQILLKVTPEELADIDRVRGDVPRARWMRELMRASVRAHEMTRGGIVHGAFSHVEGARTDDGLLALEETESTSHRVLAGRFRITEEELARGQG